MDGVNLIYKLKRQVEETQKNVQTFLLNGQVDNYEKYQYMVGQLRAYEGILQEISTLLTNKEPEDNENTGTVIDINTKQLSYWCKKIKRSHTRISQIASTHRLENINFTF